MQLCLLVGEGLTEKVTFEEKLGDGSEPSRYLGKGCSGRGTSKCKDPVVGLCLGSSKNSKETGAEWVGGSSRKGDQKDNWGQGRRTREPVHVRPCKLL